MRWASYDEVAERYDDFLEVNGYAALASDLVRLLNLPPDGSILDVGCGTGAVASAAEKAVGAGGRVVGVDVSLAMLRRSRTAGGITPVAGAVPALPFGGGVFDGVAASLVLSHVDCYEAALRDMARVLKPGGSLGVTAGARSQHPSNLAYRLWVETAESVVGAGALGEAAARALPWEAWFTDAGHVGTALADAGLDRIDVRQREYRVDMGTEEYVSMLEVFAYGRFVREALGERRWGEFRRRVGEIIAERCAARIEYTARYNVGIGTKPAA